MLPYDVDDDAAAREFINEQLLRPNATRWSELLNWDRVQQTRRVLVAIELEVQAAFAARRSDDGDMRRARGQLEISSAEYNKWASDYQDWRARTNHFRAILTKRLSDTRVEMDRARLARHDERQATYPVALKGLLESVCRAVAQHRDDTLAEYEGTAADRLLWARLDLLRLPSGRMTLSEWLKSVDRHAEEQGGATATPSTCDTA